MLDLPAGQTRQVQTPGVTSAFGYSWGILASDFYGLHRWAAAMRNANCILVVVDKFTKFAHFIPMRHSYTVESVAKLFLEHVYRLHGLPESIVSNRDKIFTSRF
jgi:hypothetical protein